MRDAFGGIVNISFIVVFMVIVNGYLAFAANYNKAFKYKNKIITVIEQHEGLDDTAKTEIHNYRLSIGYSLDNGISADGMTCVQEEGFCYKINNVATGQLDRDYYTVVTAVNISIPILEKFLTDMKIFKVSGTTKTIIAH